VITKLAAGTDSSQTSVRTTRRGISISSDPGARKSHTGSIELAFDPLGGIRMTVAPELPPASAGRRREAELPLPARAARRHPFGPAAHATTRITTSGRVGRPVRRRSPEWTDASVPSDRELAELLGLPTVADLRHGDPEPPGQGVGREHRPADPVRLRPVGSRAVGERVVRPARPRPRLTRRGQVLAGLVLLLATVSLSLAITARMQALHEPASSVPATAPAEIVVAPGETLWSIAERVAPERDPRGVVDQIRRINQLPSGEVQAGQTLRLRTP
jgi:hypothetical protein